MFEALIITLREGVEAALVLALATAVLERRGLHHLRRPLYLGAGVALAVSVVVAAFASRLVYNEEMAEGIAMLVGAVLVSLLVWWMWRAAPHFKREIEEGIDRANARTEGKGDPVGLFLFAFAMVFREGVETAIFLSASGFNSQGVGRLIGAVGGLGLAVGLGVLLMRGTIKIPLKPFFQITSAVLILIAIQLVVGGLHELSEAEVLPSSKAEMALIGPLVRSELLLFALTVALATGWLLFGPGARRTAREAGALAASGPEARLERAKASREIQWRRWTGLVSLLVVGLLTTAFVQQSRLPARAPATPLTLENGIATLDVSAVSDGHLHFFEAASSAGALRFFAIKVGDEIKTCFDACEICGNQGYFEEGGSVICRNCTAPIALPTIGRTGGCNPIPLPHRREGGKLVVSEADLQSVIPHLQGK